MKRIISLLGLLVVVVMLAGCGGTLEVGVETGEGSDAGVPAPVEEMTETTEVSDTKESEPESPEFTEQIINALNAHDEATLVGLMNDPFIIGYWRSEGLTLTPQEAVAQVFNALPEGAVLEATTDRGLFPALDGMTPEAMFGPDVDVETVVFASGWGEDGGGEAFLIVARGDDGASTWYGMVLAPVGFDDMASASPAEQIVAALNARDWDALTDQMANPFAIGNWRSEWRSLTPEQAVVPISDLLPEGAALESTTDPAGFPDLDGQPIDSLLGPDVIVEQVVFTTGWGEDGTGEALLMLVAGDAGDLKWMAMLIAPEGFD